MLNEKFVSELEGKCNLFRCPVYGGYHRVPLFVSGLSVSPQYATDACTGFKEAVNNLIIIEIKRFMSNPLPHLK